MTFTVPTSVPNNEIPSEQSSTLSEVISLVPIGSSVDVPVPNSSFIFHSRPVSIGHTFSPRISVTLLDRFIPPGTNFGLSFDWSSDLALFAAFLTDLSSLDLLSYLAWSIIALCTGTHTIDFRLMNELMRSGNRRMSFLSQR